MKASIETMAGAAVMGWLAGRVFGRAWLDGCATRGEIADPLRVRWFSILAGLAAAGWVLIGSGSVSAVFGRLLQ